MSVTKSEGRRQPSTRRSGRGDIEAVEMDECGAMRRRKGHQTNDGACCSSQHQFWSLIGAVYDKKVGLSIM